LLFLPIIFLGIPPYRRGRSSRAGFAPLVSVAAGTLALVAILGLNTTSIFADLASPAALDAMTLAMILDYSRASGARPAAAAALAGLAHFCRYGSLVPAPHRGATPSARQERLACGQRVASPFTNASMFHASWRVAGSGRFGVSLGTAA
jgi:hypothetical protein